MKIVVDDKIPYIKGVLEPYAEVVYMPGLSISASDVSDADALLVRTRTRCDEGLLAGSKVRFVATATIGTDHIDKEWCEANGIRVVSSVGCNAAGVLQWVAAVLVYLFDNKDIRPDDATLGVVGVGHVGALVERYAKMWGYNVICSDPPREAVEGLTQEDGYYPLTELAERCDIITFHTPLTKTGDFPSFGLAGERFFGSLKSGAVVVNAARGGIVDEELMKRAIDGGNCSACIDTWCGEPDIDKELLDKVLIASSHIAGYSMQGKANATSIVVNALAECFGIPLKGWYPDGVERVERTPISWDELCRTIGKYIDLERETEKLRDDPEDFEEIRETYKYRQEYF